MDDVAARDLALGAHPWLARPSAAVVRTELRGDWWWCWRDALSPVDGDAVLVHDADGWVVRFPTAYGAFAVDRHLDVVAARVRAGEAPQAALDAVANSIAGTFVVPDR